MIDRIVFIKGNEDYAKSKGQLEELAKFYDEIISFLNNYSTRVIIATSDVFSSRIPKGDIYIAHSRGCGYRKFFPNFFCLDEYEIPQSKTLKTSDKSVPYSERPIIPKSHMTFNNKMKRKLIEFIENYNK